MAFLTLETFHPHQGSVFVINLNEIHIELLLLEVSAFNSTTPHSQRQPFALLFRGPMAPVLPQQIYRLQHPILGHQEIFMVPIGPDSQGMNYEAIFT